MTRNHIGETTMVDYVLGNLNRIEEESVRSHISSCPTCAKSYYSWQQLLERNKHVQPTPELKKRIETEWNKKSNVQNKVGTKKPFFVYASIAALLFLTIG